MKDQSVIKAVQMALECGYTLIDTASIYKNETEIGMVLSEYINSGKIIRNDIFITSKISPKDQGFEKGYASIKRSLKDLQLDYLDLILIHWPGTAGIPVHDKRNKENREGTWKALEKAYEEGLVKSIGVSNYTLSHLKEMEKFETLPHVNQIEFHPLVYDDEMKDLLAYCNEKKILVQSYSTLGVGELVNQQNVRPELKQISSELNSTIAQVLLAWAIKKGCPVIPKTQSEERLIENKNALQVKLSNLHEQILDSLSSKYKYNKYCWDPHSVE